MAKALAEYLFDHEENMVRIDMSEYLEKHTVSRLIGAPPGYIGYEEAGQLTEAVRRRPYRVILFDEIEKAHPDVFNILLQILEDGRLTDGHGRTVDFRNTVVIMTSNLGTDEIGKESMGFRGSSSPSERNLLRTSIEESLKSTFRPEFLNRLDEIIIFDPLTTHEIHQIVDLMMRDVQIRLEEFSVTVELTPNAKEWLAQEGYDRVFGARPLRRAIQRFVETPLSRQILAGKVKEGDHIIVEMGENSLEFRSSEAALSKT
jgi:ATP-dependent Clp protease ATP-binding subunit ClpC